MTHPLAAGVRTAMMDGSQAIGQLQVEIFGRSIRTTIGGGTVGWRILASQQSDRGCDATHYHNLGKWATSNINAGTNRLSN